MGVKKTYNIVKNEKTKLVYAFAMLFAPKEI